MSCVAIPSMTDTLICISARLPHPLQPNVYVQMWWQEAKHPSVRGAGIPSPSTVTPVISAAVVPATQRTSACASPKRDSQGWSSSSHDDDHNSSRRVPTPWVSSSSPTSSSASGRSCADPPPIGLPPGFQSPASDADSSLTGFRPVDSPLRLRVDEALSSHREDDRDWSDAWRTQQSCSASSHATLISHLFADRGQAFEFLDQSIRRSPGPALHSDQRSRRQTDKLQILSWNPAPARGSDANLLASHWPLACDLHAGSLASSLTVPWRRAPLRRAPQQGHFHTRLLVHADPRSLLAQVLFVGRQGHGCMFHRAPDPSCSHLTVAKVHINNESAKWRSFCSSATRFLALSHR